MRIERWPAIIALRLRTLFRRGDVERDLDDEVRYHIDRQTEHNIAHGMSPHAARRAALVAFGGAGQVKEAARDQFRSPILAAVAQDARYAWRVARHTPLLSAVALATVAVAVALATSAFSAVNGVLLRALPYVQSDRLALLWGTTRGKANLDPVSFTNAMDWRRDTKSLQSLAMFSCTPRPILAARGDPGRVAMMEVSADFFSVLGARPVLGRLFAGSDYSPEAGPAIVLTHALWRDRLGGDPSVLSTRVLVDGVPTTVIGVLSPDFAPLPASLACRPEMYQPLPSRYSDAQRSWSFLKAVGRLAPGATLEAAQAELNVENARLGGIFPSTNGGRGSRIVSLRDFVIAPLRPALAFAQAGAILVLLIACANVASLLLARATVRQRELSIRLALGASRARLARQIVTECALLGVAGGVAGVLLAVVGSGVISRVAGDALPDPRGLTVDWRVLFFGAVTSLVAAMTFAAAAVAASLGEGTRSLSSLRDGGRTTSLGRVGLRRAVVAAQLAMATIVLVGAGLLARSYRHLLNVRPGFDPNGVLTARVTLPDALYPRGERQVRFFQGVVDRLTRQPGVVAAGAVSILPESPNFDRTNARVVGREYAPGEEPSPDVYRVTPGYFDAMKIPLEAGRLFTRTDDDRRPPVAVINELMARELFPGESAVGRVIWTGAGNAERTIVGVVGNTYQYGLDQKRTIQLYVPHADNSGGDLTLVARSAGDDRSLASLMRDAVRAVDPAVPVDAVMTMNQVLAESAGRRRLLAGLSLVFAAGAIALAAIGLYGVIAYSVARRTPEIGLRMALGSTATAIVRRVMGDVIGLLLAGLALGLASAMWLAKMMAPLVFGVSTADPATFVASFATLLAVALVAAVVPALRAARVNPTIALRGD
jgi:putative ABC transport system permease protein